MRRRIVLLLIALVLIHFSLMIHVFPSTNTHAFTEQIDHVQQPLWTHGMDYFCFKVQQRIADEKIPPRRKRFFQQNVQLTSPDIGLYSRQQHEEIPYRYSTWRSFPNLPRRLTPCEHYIYIELLSILDQFFRRHQIKYMMVAGTLLGSYTHHDLLPWDDDVDLRVAIHNRARMHRQFERELKNIISIVNTTDQYGNYDKMYFPWSPRAGVEIWSYPYIDVFYYDEDATHIWRTDYDGDSVQNCSVSKRDVFPLVWRPLGRLWLPAPRQPLVVFEMQGWTFTGELYFANNYSHKHERSMPFIDGRARAYELHSYYPWVRRDCSDTHCIEQLLFTYNDTNHTIHTIQFETYRTTLVFNPKLANKKCPL